MPKHGPPISQRMHDAMKQVRMGVTPYRAAKNTGIALSTMYISELYKAWKAEGKPVNNLSTSSSE